ncbi:MAG: squalene/phytoene synthase family protein, partial [Chloroflexota bacterium]
SRSFALVVSYVEEPLREYLSAAYLVCRVVDNIEDCTEPYEWRRRRFEDFELLLAEPGKAASTVERWGAYAWSGLAVDEKRLMGPKDGAMLWQIYADMPLRARQVIGRWARDMAQGMRQIEDPDQAPLLVHRDGVQILATQPDYNEYCYYVAGTVGYLATELAVDFYDIAGPNASQLQLTSQACARGLQKTNIVKDFRKDLARGVSYLPDDWLRQADYRPLELAGAPVSWKRQVIGDVLAELREATQYILALPYEAAGYRIGSLLCLFPAYQTLLRAAERGGSLFTSDHNMKISRFTMLNCIRDARSLVRDNEAVLAYSRAAEEAVESLLA